MNKLEKNNKKVLYQIKNLKPAKNNTVNLKNQSCSKAFMISDWYKILILKNIF